jgi:hypothetical protein
VAGALPPVQPREVPAEAPAHILAAHHRVLGGEQNNWLHHMTWLLWTKSGHDLEIVLPPSARIAAAFLDDQPTPPLQTGAQTLTLPIPPGAKPRSVVVCWTFPASIESIAEPNLMPAKLLGLAPVTVVGALHVPPGWRPADKNPFAPVADILLNEAKTEALAFQILGDDLASAGKASQGPLVQSLQTFAALVDQAQFRIRLAEGAEARAGELKALVADEHKRAKSFGIDAARIAAESSPWLAAPRPSIPGGDRGAPVGWLQTPEAQAPRIELRPAADVPSRGLLAPLAIVVFIVSFWPRGLALWVHLWPEQLAAAAALGFAFGGFSFIGVGLLMTAFFGRALNLAHVARRFLGRRHA